MVTIKDSLKLFGIAIVVCCAAFVCTLFLNYRIDLVNARDSISGEQAVKIADQLLEALDEFDDDLSKELIVKLGGYPFRTTQKESLNKAKELVEDFMYDDAADMVKEIIPTIE